MISFFCQQCRRPIRVTDACRGKKGRCPHCKASVEIPIVSDPVAEHTQAIQAAVAGGPPKPPQSLHVQEARDASSDTDIDMVMPADPNDETNRMDALLDAGSSLSSGKPGSTRPMRSSALVPAPVAKGSNRTTLMVAVVLLILLSAGVLFVMLRHMRVGPFSHESVTEPAGQMESAPPPNASPSH